MAIIEYVDRPGEIRAARPPKARRERLLAAMNTGQEDGDMKDSEVTPEDMTTEEADALTQDADFDKSK